MKQKLIDREKLRMELRKLFAEYPNLIDKGLAYAVEDVIDEAPIVEAEPVVRCKDCEFYSGEYQYCANDFIIAKRNGYCSFGERRK